MEIHIIELTPRDRAVLEVALALLIQRTQRDIILMTRAGEIEHAQMERAALDSIVDLAKKLDVEGAL